MYSNSIADEIVEPGRHAVKDATPMRGSYVSRTVLPEPRKDSVSSAARVVRTLRQRMNSVLLPELVNIGRPGRREGTRELIEWPYIIVYTVDEDRTVITMLAVVYGDASTLNSRRIL